MHRQNFKAAVIRGSTDALFRLNSDVESIFAAGACCSMLTLDSWESQDILALWATLINVCLAVSPLVLCKCAGRGDLTLDFGEKSLYLANADEIELIFLLASIYVFGKYSEESIYEDEQLNNRQHPFSCKEVDHGEDDNCPEQEMIQLIDAVSSVHKGCEALAPAWLSAAVCVHMTGLLSPFLNAKEMHSRDKKIISNSHYLVNRNGLLFTKPPKFVYNFFIFCLCKLYEAFEFFTSY